MLRNIIHIVKVIICCITAIAGSYSCAEVSYIPVEIKCSNSPLTAQEVVFQGMPGVQYTLVTRGILEEGREDILETIKTDGIGRTRDGLYVCVAASCIPTDKETNMSLTGILLTCKRGEGMEITMFAPCSNDPNRYRYVGILTLTGDEEKMQKILDGTMVPSYLDKEQLLPTRKSTFPTFGTSYSYVY